MTGYSKSEAKTDGASVTTEIKSFNNRYLEVNCKLPKLLSHKEPEIRDLIRNKFTRGNITVMINFNSDLIIAPLQFDEKAMIECYKKLNNIKSKMRINEPINFDHLLHFSSYFITKEDENISETLWAVVRKSLLEGINDLDKMRRKEGREIEKDLKKRMQTIKNIIAKVEELGIKRIPGEREKMRYRIAQLFESDEIDEQRLLTEMVLLADKLDISEECVRLNSHIKFFFEAMKENESPGRKINFLLQEIHREINTIGSKANDAQISQLVVKLKDEVERIREQIQNIE